MAFKYALIDFFTDRSVHICGLSELRHGNMSLLSQENLSKWDKQNEAFLWWRSSPTAEPERWPCHIIQISGECYILATFIILHHDIVCFLTTFAPLTL